MTTTDMECEEYVRFSHPSKQWKLKNLPEDGVRDNSTDEWKDCRISGLNALSRHLDKVVGTHLYLHWPE